MRLKKINLVLFTAFFSLFFTACKQEESLLPTYLRLHPAVFKTQPNTGTKHQNIEDYWLYVDHKIIGVIPTNNVIPVIGDGIKDISILPGIRVNGLRDNAYVYSFLQPFNSSVTLCQCADTIDIYPQFEYKNEALFSFVEDFENSNRFTIDLDQSSATNAVTQTTTAAEGSYSLALNVSASASTNSITTLDFYKDFLSDGRDVFLEFEYKSDFPFLVGIQTHLTSGDFLEYAAGIYATQEWKKMYINFTDLVLASKSTGGYRPVFTVTHPGGTIDPGNLYIDNIKLVHY